MCDFLMESEKTSAEAFKIVALNLETGKHHSILTGEAYPGKGKPMPVWISQENQIMDYFAPGVLPGCQKVHEYKVKSFRERCGPWVKNMLGRTAAFPNKDIAHFFFHQMKYNTIGSLRIVKEGFKIVLAKVRLTGKLWNGYYQGEEVVISEYIEFLPEGE